MGGELMSLLKRLGPEGAALLEKIKAGAMGAGKGAAGMASRSPRAASALGGAAAGAGGMSLASLMGDDDEDDEHLGI